MAISHRCMVRRKSVAAQAMIHLSERTSRTSQTSQTMDLYRQTSGTLSELVLQSRTTPQKVQQPWGLTDKVDAMALHHCPSLGDEASQTKNNKT